MSHNDRTSEQIHNTSQKPETTLPATGAEGSSLSKELQTDKKEPSVARSAALMSAATLLSRATGFLRTWACAFALGNTLLTSSYQIANSMPNMLYELVAGGILSTAFLPVFLSMREKDGDGHANSYASNLLNICMVILGAIALIATLFAPHVMATQTFMTGGEDAELATWFFRFFAVQIFFYGVGAIINGLLNAQKQFLWPALGPVFNNIMVIVTMFLYAPLAAHNSHAALVLLAVGTTLGVVVQLSVQIPALLKTKFHYTFKIDLHEPALKETAKLAVPAIIFTAINLICVSVKNAFALDVSPTGPSTLTYAWLWYQFPYGVLAVALSTAMFTEMSTSAGRGDMAAFKGNVRTGLRGTFFLIIPMALMLITLSSLLVTLYHAGQFTESDIEMVTSVLTWWAVCLPFYAGYMYLYFAFSSLKRLMTVTKVNFFASLVQIALYALLTSGIGNWSGLGLIGIPLADTVFFTIMFVTLFLLLRKEIGGFGGRQILGVAAKTLLAGCVGGAIALLLRQVMGDTTSILWAFIQIIIAGGAGLVVTYALCAIMKVEEMNLLKKFGRRLTGRLKRSRK